MKILFLLIFLGALACLWGYYSSGLVLSNVRLPILAHPKDLGIPFEDVVFTARDGISLRGWFLPAEGSSSKTILLCHGFGANRGDLLPSCLYLRAGGYNLFCFDFRAHGESEGNISTLCGHEVKDFDAALDFLKAQKSQAARSIGVYGLSMGAAVSITGSAHRPEVKAVAAESPFRSVEGVIIRFARLFYSVPRYPFLPLTLAFVRWRAGMNVGANSPIRHVAQISPRPLLLIQGAKDIRMPLEEGQGLFAAAGEPKELWIVPDADHGEAHSLAGLEYEKRVLEFFKKYL